jgi:hypothetical protein
VSIKDVFDNDERLGFLKSVNELYRDAGCLEFDANVSSTFWQYLSLLVDLTVDVVRVVRVGKLSK